MQLQMTFCLAAGALALLPMFSPGTALAVKASPPTVTCSGKCEACLEMEQGGRCVKCGIDPKCLGGDPGLSSDFTEMLKAHNIYRGIHGTPALAWSPDLAKGAQEWANACTPDPKSKDGFAHSKQAWSSAACCGENLYWGAQTTANNAVDWWYAENKNYDSNNPYESFKAGDTNSNKEVRHFTQVVWKDSERLGCAVANCGGKNFWVCRYAPTGNWNADKSGVLAANVLPPGGVPQTQSAATQPKSSGTELWYIKARHSGKCLHQHGATKANGAKITQWDCVDQPNVKLERIALHDGTVFLRFAHSNKCVHLHEASKANGAAITQWDCIDQPNVKWRIEPADGDFVYLRSPSSGKCIHQHGGTHGNGDKITQWACIDRPNVQWQFVRAP